MTTSKRKTLCLIAVAMLLMLCQVVGCASDLKMREVDQDQQPEPIEWAELQHDVCEAPEPYVPETPGRYESIRISNSDKALLALCAYHEARGDGVDGMRAVIEVILNRCLNNKFPNTVEGVIYQTNQFSTASAITAKPIKEPASLTEAFEAVDYVLSNTDYLLENNIGYFKSTPYKSCSYMKLGRHYFARM